MDEKDLEVLVLSLASRLNVAEGRIEVLEAEKSLEAAFDKPLRTINITIKREGDSLGYSYESENPTVHFSLPSNEITGRFIRLEVLLGEYEGEDTITAVLHIKNERKNVVFRVRMNADLGPRTSVALKTFLGSFAHVPDTALQSDLMFALFPGNKAATVTPRVLNPLTRRGWRDLSTSDEVDEGSAEDLKQRWSDQAYQKELLETAIARITAASSSSFAPPSSKATNVERTAPTQKLVIKPPSSESGSAPVAEEKPLVMLTGELRDKGELTPHRDRSYITFSVEAKDETHSCMAWDTIATRVSVLFENGSSVEILGKWLKDKSGSPCFKVNQIDLVELPNVMDLSDLITRIDVEMCRVGMTKQQARDYLKEVYGKVSRQQLAPGELAEFLNYLQEQPAVSAAILTEAV